MFPLLPVLLLLAVWGAAWLRQSPRVRPLLVILLIIQPIWAFARVGWGRWIHRDPDVAPELFNPKTRALLEAAVPTGTLCIVGPDISGCKYFYFLHKKGFGFTYPEQLSEKTFSGVPYIAACINSGAQYLYTNDASVIQNSRLQPYLIREIKHVGDFSVWQLRSVNIHP